MTHIAAYPCHQISFEKKDLIQLVKWMSELKDEPYEVKLVISSNTTTIDDHLELNGHYFLEGTWVLFDYKISRFLFITEEFFKINYKEPYQTNLGMCTSLKEKKLVEKEYLSKEEWIQEIISSAKFAKKFLDTHEPNTDFYSVAAVGYLRELIALCEEGL